MEPGVLHESVVDSISITTLMVQAPAHNIIFSWALIARPLQELSRYQKAPSGVTVKNLFSRQQEMVRAMLNRAMLPLSWTFVLVYFKMIQWFKWTMQIYLS